MNRVQQFDYIRTLGEGNHGKVILMKERETGNKFAYKSIRKQNLNNDVQLLKNIQKEFDIMSHLNHPNIISVYDVYETRDKVTIRLEYASGGDLFDYVNTKHGLSDAECKRLFQQIVSAVDYIHQLGIVHRDLKLENILLDSNFNAKIADFGLANFYSEDFKLNTFCGSPLYIPPEVIMGIPYSGPEMDCWSLGVLLYAMTYGLMPFDGTDFKKLKKAICEANYTIYPTSSGACDLIQHLLVIDIDKRATIPDMLEHWWLSGQSTPNKKKSTSTFIPQNFFSSTACSVKSSSFQPSNSFVSISDLIESLSDNIQNTNKLVSHRSCEYPCISPLTQCSFNTNQIYNDLKRPNYSSHPVIRESINNLSSEYIDGNVKTNLYTSKRYHYNDISLKNKDEFDNILTANDVGLKNFSYRSRNDVINSEGSIIDINNEESINELEISKDSLESMELKKSNRTSHSIQDLNFSFNVPILKMNNNNIEQNKLTCVKNTSNDILSLCKAGSENFTNVQDESVYFDEDNDQPLIDKHIKLSNNRKESKHMMLKKSNNIECLINQDEKSYSLSDIDNILGYDESDSAEFEGVDDKWIGIPYPLQMDFILSTMSNLSMNDAPFPRLHSNAMDPEQLLKIYDEEENVPHHYEDTVKKQLIESNISFDHCKTINERDDNYNYFVFKNDYFNALECLEIPCRNFSQDSLENLA